MAAAEVVTDIDEYLLKRLMPVEGAIPHLTGIEMYEVSLPCQILCGTGPDKLLNGTRPQSKYLTVAEDRLAAAGVTTKQVQVGWLKQANAATVLDFPEEARRLQDDLAGTIHVMRDRYPNLKIVYLSSRIYAGFAHVSLNPEPYAYESGFSVQWLIEDQIKGNPDLNYDPAKGLVKAVAGLGPVSLGGRQLAAQRPSHLRARRPGRRRNASRSPGARQDRLHAAGFSAEGRERAALVCRDWFAVI